MIISHKYKFIYFRSHKTAGTSVEIALTRSCGSDDVIAPLPAFKEIMDETMYPHDGRNCPPIFSHHSRPDVVRSVCIPKVWQSYKKIVNVRNPWDCAVSKFFFEFKPKLPEDCDPAKVFRPRFERWMKKGFRPLNNPYFYDENGEEICDRYIRFECLVKDYHAICDEFGVKKHELPRTKTKLRPKGLSYQQMFDEKTREIVTRNSRWVIERFGYTFEG